jgi:hypothetical protein
MRYRDGIRCPLGFCDETKSGQTLISARVLMAVEDAVMVKPGWRFPLKGIRRRLAAYNVLAALSMRDVRTGPDDNPGRLAISPGSGRAMI